VQVKPILSAKTQGNKAKCFHAQALHINLIADSATSVKRGLRTFHIMKIIQHYISLVTQRTTKQVI